MYSFLHGLLVQSYTSQLTDQCAHKRHWNSGQHNCRFHPTLLLKVLYPNVQTWPYKKSESGLTNVFSELKKYFHKTEGKLTQACSSSSHKPHSNLRRAETAETQVPTPYFIQTFHKAKLDPGELLFLSQR